MNQRIQQLERQAIIGVLKGNDPDRDVDRMYISAEFTKKFAQLILQECLTICQHNAEDDDDQFDLGRVHQSKEITHLIKKHFGVEE